MKIRLHRFTPLTRTEGPGERACIQVQGCPIRCFGCAVPQTWTEKGGAWVDVDALIDAILLGPPVEGVTFLGGEPFAQPGPLAHIGKALRERDLSVVAFTGYRLDDLRVMQDPEIADLLAVTDLLIDGPFDQGKVDYSRPWVGSTNQRYHHLTDRYADFLRAPSTSNGIEVRISTTGAVIVSGLAPLDSMRAIAQTSRSAARC